MTRYAVIFGFGLFDETNLKYKAYLDRFAKLVAKKKIDAVVLCGGHTNVEFPEKSEAGTMAAYLTPILPDSVKIYTEDRSLTTEQNVKFAKELLDLSPENKIFLVADSVRFFKDFWFVLHHWYGLTKEEIITQLLSIMLTEISENPKRTIELKEIKKKLKYKNTEIVIDALHKDYLNAMHTIITELFEIEALYDPKVYDKYMEMTRAKFRVK
jgi:putative lipoic acid-binding regulatory protein